MVKYLLISLVLFQGPPAKQFSAFGVSAHYHELIALDKLQYQPCALNLSIDKKKFVVAGDVYTIDYSEPFTDTNRMYFGHRLQGVTRVQCSFGFLRSDKPEEWTILVTWQDSAKAFKAIVSPSRRRKHVWVEGPPRAIVYPYSSI